VTTQERTGVAEEYVAAAVHDAMEHRVVCVWRQGRQMHGWVVVKFVRVTEFKHLTLGDNNIHFTTFISVHFFNAIRYIFFLKNGIFPFEPNVFLFRFLKKLITMFQNP